MRRSLQSFDDFVRCIEVFLGDESPPKAWQGRRSASIARRSAACDHLVTAALVHDFAACLGERGSLEELASASADLLQAVFPAQVLTPLRLIDAASAHATGSRALAQGRRLRRFVEGAAAQSDGLLLPWPSLRSIARRASLDG